jgi:hypothetical protein
MNGGIPRTLSGFVDGTIIDQDYFPVIARPRYDFMELLHQRFDITFFIICRNNDADSDFSHFGGIFSRGTLAGSSLVLFVPPFRPGFMLGSESFSPLGSLPKLQSLPMPDLGLRWRFIDGLFRLWRHRFGKELWLGYRKSGLGLNV